MFIIHLFSRPSPAMKRPCGRAVAPVGVPWPQGCAKKAKVARINMRKASASRCTTMECLEARISFEIKGSPCMTMKASLLFIIKGQHFTYCHALHSHHDGRLLWRRPSPLTMALPSFDRQIAQPSLSCSLLGWRLCKSTAFSHSPQWSPSPRR